MRCYFARRGLLRGRTPGLSLFNFEGQVDKRGNDLGIIQWSAPNLVSRDYVNLNVSLQKSASMAVAPKEISFGDHSWRDNQIAREHTCTSSWSLDISDLPC